MRILSSYLVSVFIFAGFILSGCQQAPVPIATPIFQPDETVRIGLVVQAGGIDDGNFNELSYAGVSNVSRRLGLVFDYVSTSDYATAINGYASSGYHIVITVGFDMIEATVTAAVTYPDVYFVGIDQPHSVTHENLIGITFPNDQAGYLAGVLAANLTETNIVGGIYGSRIIEPVVAFSVGFESGAKSVNPDIEVRTIFHPEEETSIAFNDPAWGETTAREYLADGVDVIFTAAGATGNGALVTVANAADEENPPYCIGVDTDQWETIPQARKCLVSSAMKSIPQAIDDVVVQIVAGEVLSGNIQGPVQLAPFHTFDPQITDNLKAELSQLADDLLSGAVDTQYSFER